MSALPIVLVPNKALTTKADAVENINDGETKEKIRKLAEDMAETMYKAPGVGLAANQVGELLRLIVVDVAYQYSDPQDRKKNPIFILNPQISMSEGEAIREEGCLSVPEFGVEVKRAERVRVHGVDLDGNPVTIDAEGLLARALQHEIDHINGKTILDHASSLKRGLYQRRLKKKMRRDR